MRFSSFVSALSLVVLGAATHASAPIGDKTTVESAAAQDFSMTEVARFDDAWAMAFLPGTPYALVTERKGRLKLWQEDGPVRDVAGVPEVDPLGQGGLGDIKLSPDFAATGLIYLSWVESGENDTRGGVLGRGKLVLDGTPRIEGLQVIWRQQPKVIDGGHYSYRIAFSPDGRYLFLSSGERQKLAPAQDLETNLGKVLRLMLDGQPAPGNPFAAKGGVSREIWSYGHRNLLGLKFDAEGRLWDLEHGPQGGDELNLVKPGQNYGWPLVSDGDHYDGTPIPRHATRPDLTAPAISWNPVIAPGDFIFYRGNVFPEWRGQAIIAAMKPAAIVRVAITGETAREVARVPMPWRVREILEREDGTVWVLQDNRGPARLVRFSPAPQ